MEDLQQFIKKCEPSKARKRPVNKSQWKREASREKRYKPHSLPVFPSCGHNRKAFQCTTLTCTNVRRFNQSFYKESKKIYQDNFIIKFCNIAKSKTAKIGSKRNHSLKYFIRGNGGKMVPVCQKTFTGALCIKKDRVQGVMRRFYEKEEMAQERRGGDRKSQKFEEKRKAVETFIESFKANESHYCRAKNIKRLYLSPELNIRKLWRMFNDAHPRLQVKQHFFRKIFVSRYNIGFGTPRTDVCSTCLRLDEHIKKENQEILSHYCKLTDFETIAVRDWKSAYTPIVKPTTSWHVQFKKCKRFFLTRSKTNNMLLQGEISYRNSINVKKPITKNNKSINMLDPGIIPANQIVPKIKKITDVSKLLTKHYGEHWKDMEQLAFYRIVEDRKSNEQEDHEEDSIELPNELCEDGFDDVDLIVRFFKFGINVFTKFVWKF